MPKSERLYAKPMLINDAARTVERAALILRAEADRMEREVMRLNQREMVTHAEAVRLRYEDMRIPRVMNPADAKPTTGRPRKEPA
jgi:hypothetical protein